MQAELLLLFANCLVSLVPDLCVAVDPFRCVLHAYLASRNDKKQWANYINRPQNAVFTLPSPSSNISNNNS